MGAFDNYDPLKKGQAPPPPAPIAPPPVTAPASPAQPPVAPSASDILLQHLGSGGPLAGLFPPASPGPQTWGDWATKTYSPSSSDFAKAYADAVSYHLAPVAAQAAKAAGLPFPSAEDLRSGAATARQNLGPMSWPVAGLGYATSPLTYFGVGPASRAFGELGGAEAAKVLPEVLGRAAPRVLEGGAIGGAIGGTQAAGEGGGPADIALGTGAGALVGGGAAGLAGALPLGRATAADVSRRTAQAAQTAQDQLAKVTVPAKDIGFRFKTAPGGPDQQNPSAADLLDYQNWLKTVSPEADPSGASPVLQRRLSQALAQEPVAAAVQNAQDAAQRAQNAQTLERWGSTEGLPGVDVRGQASEASQGFPIGSPQNAALQGIARVQEPGPALPRTVRSAMTTGGALLGDIGSHFVGYPGGGTAGATVGSGAANVLEDILRPKSVSPLIQQQIARAYPAMTGQPATGPGANDAVARALMQLYFNRPDLTRPR